MTHRVRLNLLLIGALGLLLVWGAEEAHAGVLTVASTADSGPMTLRQAMAEAGIADDLMRGLRRLPLVLS